MRGREVHLVGSIPLHSAGEVFRVVSGRLGPRVSRIPDGETGERSHWLGWIEPVFSTHPAFEPTGETSRVHATSDPRPLHRIKPGMVPDSISFRNLRIADAAIQSFAEFRRLKTAGFIRAQCRYQVAIANPISVVHRFVAEEFQEAVVDAYERALLAEIEKIAASIPHHELAIQWDIAQHVFTPLESNTSTRFGGDRAEMLRAFGAMAVRWGNTIPAGVELLYHLCYGDNAHRHAVEPSSLAIPVAFANEVSAAIGRTIELIHMPVPRNRSDDAYFEPLRNLRLRPETRIALGLVHYSGGVEGTRRRIAAAEKYLSDFSIATECGFGRRAPETIPELLRIHAEVAETA
jgi:hypothetical protein